MSPRRQPTGVASGVGDVLVRLRLQDLLTMLRVLPTDRLDELAREFAPEVSTRLRELSRPRAVVDSTRSCQRRLRATVSFPLPRLVLLALLAYTAMLRG